MFEKGSKMRLTLIEGGDGLYTLILPNRVEKSFFAGDSFGTALRVVLKELAADYLVRPDQKLIPIPLTLQETSEAGKYILTVYFQQTDYESEGLGPGGRPAPIRLIPSEESVEDFESETELLKYRSEKEKELAEFKYDYAYEKYIKPLQTLLEGLSGILYFPLAALAWGIGKLMEVWDSADHWIEVDTAETQLHYSEYKLDTIKEELRSGYPRKTQIYWEKQYADWWLINRKSQFKLDILGGDPGWEILLSIPIPGDIGNAVDYLRSVIEGMWEDYTTPSLSEIKREKKYAIGKHEARLKWLEKLLEGYRNGWDTETAEAKAAEKVTFKVQENLEYTFNDEKQDFELTGELRALFKKNDELKEKHIFLISRAGDTSESGKASPLDAETSIDFEVDGLAGAAEGATFVASDFGLTDLGPDVEDFPVFEMEELGAGSLAGITGAGGGKPFEVGDFGVTDLGADVEGLRAFETEGLGAGPVAEMPTAGEGDYLGAEAAAVPGARLALARAGGPSVEQCYTEGAIVIHAKEIDEEFLLSLSGKTVVNGIEGGDEVV